MSTDLHPLEMIAHEAAQRLPEIPVIAVVETLLRVQRLGLTGDRRLMGLDSANLSEGITRAVRLRAEGISTPAMETAIADLARLAEDMQDRAEALIAQEAEQFAIHAAVSSHQASDGPRDVTSALRILAAAPLSPASKDDTPGILLGIDHLCPDGTYGRISGSLFTYTGESPHNAAPQGAAVLPAGCLVRLGPGEAVILHTTGAGHFDRFNAPPQQDTITNSIVEAGPEGAVLYGPAVFTPYAGFPGTLSQVFDAHNALATAHDQLRVTDTEGVVLSTFVGGAFGTMASMILFEATEILPWFAGIPLGLVIAGAIAGCFGQQRASAYQRVRHLIAHMPEAITTGGLRMQSTAVLKAVGDTWNGVFRAPDSSARGPRMLRELPSLPKNLLTQTQQGTGFNFHPARVIEARDADDLRVMQPLIALPKPTADIVPLRPHQQAVL